MLEPVSGAAFLRNHAGEVCISLTDPAFVHSDAIVVDRSTLCVFAVFHEAAHYLGSVSHGMADAFSQKKHVVLSALRADGTVFELTAPICTRSIGNCQGACCQ